MLREIGRRLPQKGAADRVSGKSVYTQDVVLPGMHFGAILRSPHAHARIVSIDTTAAESVPGVSAVITAADFEGRKYLHFGGTYSDRNPLALDRVRYWGEEVAAVSAETPAIAEEACRLIQVVYEPLTAVLTPEAAMRDVAPALHEPANMPYGKNVALHAGADFGDVETALKQAAFVLDDIFEHGIVAPACMETNGTVARYDEASARLELWTTTQAPYFIQKEIAHLLGWPLERVRIRSVELGGGFGGKAKICEQEALAARLSVKALRPVKITLDRRAEFVSGKTDHAKRMRLRTAVAGDGRIVNRWLEAVVDNGAYTASAPTYVAAARQRNACLYRVETARYAADLVYTNKVPGGAYRGMGAPQVIWAIESHMDVIAARLGRDPLEYRIAQANRSGDVTPLGWRISSCGLADCLGEVGRMIGWDGKRTSRAPYRGVGVASMIHPSGGVIYAEGNVSRTRIDLLPGGTFVVRTQNADAGTGQNTSLAQLAAETLGVPTELVSVSHMDTDEAPHDLGSTASRVAFVVGNATIRAAARLGEAIRASLSPRWNCSEADIRIDGDRIRNENDPAQEISFADFVETFGPRGAEGEFSTPGERPDPKTGYGNYAATYVFAAQAAEVEIDRATGRIKVLNVAVAQDVGRALNPLALEGQIYGGVLQGIGMALQEELVFEEGRPVNATFLDYRVPRIAEAPRIAIKLVETVDPLGPYGAKAGAEPTINATVAAIANAVFHATGIRFTTLPMTPQRVLAALEEKERSQTAPLKPWKRPMNAEVAAVRSLYQPLVFPALRSVGTKFARVPRRNVEPMLIPARSIEELLAALEQEDRRTKIVAGGTDLLVGMKQGIYDPDILVDVTAIGAMRGVTLSADGAVLSIGAATALEDVRSNGLVARLMPVVSSCIAQIATQQIRQVATVAGDLCQEKRCWFFRSAFPCYKLGGPTCPCFAVLGDNRHHSIIGARRCAAPCPADLAPMFAALDARAVMASTSGERVVSVEDLYLWSGLTKVARGEAIVRVEIPVCPDTTAVFEKFAIRQGDFAEASVAVRLRWASDTIVEARIALGSVSPFPVRAGTAEQRLVGLSADAPDEALRHAAEATVESSLPLRDNGYKTALLINLAERALRRAVGDRHHSRTVTDVA